MEVDEMNKIGLYGMLAGFLFVTACSDTTESDPQSNAEQDTEAGEEGSSESMEVMEETETEEGTFSIYERYQDLTSYEEGSMNIRVNQVDLGSAELVGFVSATTGEEQIDYVEVEMEIENTSGDTVYFPYGETSVETNTGESIDTPSIVLSDEIDPDFAAGDVKTVQLLFPVESVQNLNEVVVTMNGPSTEVGGDQVGEDLQFTVELAS